MRDILPQSPNYVGTYQEATAHDAVVLGIGPTLAAGLIVAQARIDVSLVGEPTALTSSSYLVNDFTHGMYLMPEAPSGAISGAGTSGWLCWGGFRAMTDPRALWAPSSDTAEDLAILTTVLQFRGRYKIPAEATMGYAIAQYGASNPSFFVNLTWSMTIIESV